MNNFAPTYISTLSPPTADPASPMQATYSQMGSKGFLPRGACTMQSIPHHPPPNYTQATAMTGDVLYHGHLPPNYDSIMTGSEYSQQTTNTHHPMT